MPGLLLHFSEKPFILRSNVIKQQAGLKPSGLWLSVGGAWIAFVESSMPANSRKQYSEIAFVQLEKGTKLFKVNRRNVATIEKVYSQATTTETIRLQGKPLIFNIHTIDWKHIQDQGFAGVDFRPKVHFMQQQKPSFVLDYQQKHVFGSPV